MPPLADEGLGVRMALSTPYYCRRCCRRDLWHSDRDWLGAGHMLLWLW